MAKKPNKDDKVTKFDDINFDDNMDFDDLDFGDTPKTTAGKVRKVVSEARSGFVESLKSEMTNKESIKKFLGIALPPGYSQAITAYDSINDAFKDVYDANREHIEPYMARANKQLDKSSSGLKRFLPNFITNALENAEYNQRDKSYDPGQSGLDQSLEELQKLFALQASSEADQKISDQRRELKDDRKFSSSFSAQARTAVGIERLVSYQDKILINYQRRNLELGYRSYDVQAKMLKIQEAYYKDSITRLTDIQKNTSLPDYVKLKGSEALRERIRSKLHDSVIGGVANYRQGFFKNVTSGASDFISGALGGMGMIKDTASMMVGGDIGQNARMTGNVAGTFAAGKAASARDFLASQLAPMLDKVPGLREKGGELRDMFADPVGFMNRFATGEDTDSGIASFFKGILRTFLPRYSPMNKLFGNEIDSLQDPAVFDNNFYTTVTQIMPQYLESMEKSLRSLVTGQDEEGMAFSHYTGSMVSRSTLDNQHVRIGLFQGKGNTIRDEVSKLMGTMQADILSPKARMALSRRLFKDLQSGNGFDPKDYIDINAWSDIDEETANELIMFFTDQFELDNEGNFIGKDKNFTADIREAFVDASNRMPKILERMSVLAKEGLIPRDVMRRLGITNYAGNYTDTVNDANWTDLALGIDPIDVIKTEEEKEKEKNRGMFNVKGMMEDYQKEIAEQLEKQLKEQALKDEQASLQGRHDNIDLAQRGLGKISSLPRLSQQEITRSGVRDNDLLLSMDTRLGVSNEYLKLISSKLDRQRTASAARTESAPVSKADAKTAKDIEFFEQNPRVVKIMAKVEEIKGKITDPKLRAKVLERIYSMTGTPEQIAEKVSTWYDTIAGKARAGYASAKASIKDHYGRRGEHYESLRSGIRQGYDNLSQWAGSIENPLKGMELPSLSDKGTHDRLDIANKLLSVLASGGRSDIDVGASDDKGSKDKPGRLSRVLSGLTAALGLGKNVAVGTAAATASYTTSVWGLTYDAMKIPFKAARSVLGDRIYGVRDVYVKGEKEPRLRAVDIRKGMYFNKNGNKTLKSHKDIKGAVIDGTTGNEVISQDEYKNDMLILGNGDSLLTLIGRTGLNIATGVASLTTSYFVGTYGMMFKMGKALYEMSSKTVRDQFTQFDAYVPGETIPRIRSKLMSQGFYRNEKGEPILTLDQIKPDSDVLDINGNIVLSKEEMGKFKNLYKRNGSLLFTFGRGLGTVTRWGASKIGGFVNYATLGLQAGAWVMRKGLDRVTKMIKGKGKLGGGVNTGLGSQDGLEADILFEQLRIQKSILDSMHGRYDPDSERSTPTKPKDFIGPVQPKQSPIHDEDGDGIRDNSFRDIMEKRKARRANSPNQDIVDAIDTLGSRLDGNFERLSSKKGFLGKLGGWMGALLGAGGGLMSKIGLGKIGGMLGSAGSTIAEKGLLRGGLSLAGSALKGTAKLGLKAAWGATKFIATKAVPALVKGAIWAGGAIVSALGWPVVLAGIAIGAVAYLGYKHFKKMSLKKAILFHLRMAQYGVDGTDGDKVDQILQLETLLSAAVKGIGSDKVEFDETKANNAIHRAYRIFKLLPDVKEGEDPDQVTEEEYASMDVEKRKQFIDWLAYRFKPVYLRHLSATHFVTKQDDLNKVVDLVVSKEEMNEFLDRVHIPGGDELYNIIFLPRESGVWNSVVGVFSSDGPDAEKVHEYFKIARNKAKELPSKDTVDKNDAIATEAEQLALEAERREDGDKVAEHQGRATKTDLPDTSDVDIPDRQTDELSGDKIVKSPDVKLGGTSTEAQAPIQSKATQALVGKLPPVGDDDPTIREELETLDDLSRMGSRPKTDKNLDLEGFKFILAEDGVVYAKGPGGELYPTEVTDVRYSRNHVQRVTKRRYIKGLTPQEKTYARAIRNDEIESYQEAIIKPQQEKINKIIGKKSDVETTETKDTVNSPIVLKDPTATPITPKSELRRRDVPKVEQESIKLTSKTSAAKTVVESVEARKLDKMNETTLTTNELMSEVVGKLTSIDTTLLEIKEIIPDVANHFLQQKLEMSKLTGKDLAQSNNQKIANFTEYSRRNNGSTQRRNAVT